MANRQGPIIIGSLTHFDRKIITNPANEHQGQGGHSLCAFEVKKRIAGGRGMHNERCLRLRLYGRSFLAYPVGSTAAITVHEHTVDCAVSVWKVRFGVKAQGPCLHSVSRPFSHNREPRCGSRNVGLHTCERTSFREHMEEGEDLDSGNATPYDQAGEGMSLITSPSPRPR